MPVLHPPPQVQPARQPASELVWHRAAEPGPHQVWGTHSFFSHELPSMCGIASLRLLIVSILF